MTARIYTSSPPTQWVLPRPQSGFSREYVHGKVLPMDYERPRLGWLRWIFGRG